MGVEPMATLTVTLTDTILDAMDDDAILALRPALIDRWDAERTVRYEGHDGCNYTQVLRARRLGGRVLLWADFEAAEEDEDPGDPADPADVVEVEELDGDMAEHLAAYASRYADAYGFGEL